MIAGKEIFVFDEKDLASFYQAIKKMGIIQVISFKLDDEQKF